MKRTLRDKLRDDVLLVRRTVERKIYLIKEV